MGKLPDGVGETGETWETGGPEAPPLPEWPYLLAFHSCDMESDACGNPENHRIHLAGSEDGWAWSPVEGLPEIQASVPDILYRDGFLYLYAVPNLHRYDISSGIWEDPEPISIDGMEGGFVDPCAMLDDDGRILLFYLHTDQEGDPATCPSGELSCTKSFRAAAELSGSDGAAFGEPSEVLSLDLQAGQIAADPDVFAHPEGYLLYLSRGQSVQVFYSSVPMGPYSIYGALPGGVIADSGGVPSGHYDFGQENYWTLATRHMSGDGRTDIVMAVHPGLESLGPSDFQPLGLLAGFSPTELVSSPGLLVTD
jgi:hypothetical protein